MNEIQLVGRISNDVEMKISKNEKEFLIFNLAIKDDYDFEKTHFFPIAMFGAKAKWGSKYLLKGDLIFISGKINFNSVKDEKGNSKNYFKVIVNRISPLESKTTKEMRNQLKNINEDESDINIFDESMFEI